jgi:hypothetical protein
MYLIGCSYNFCFAHHELSRLMKKYPCNLKNYYLYFQQSCFVGFLLHYFPKKGGSLA